MGEKLRKNFTHKILFHLNEIIFTLEKNDRDFWVKI